MSFAQAVLADTFGTLAPLVAAAIGALATEYVGVLNIALEGLMSLGGFTFIVVGSFWGPVPGIAAALFTTMLAAWAQDAFARRARADAFVVGLAVNLAVPALASVLSSMIFGTKGVVPVPSLLSPRLAPILSRVPIAGALFQLRMTDILAFAIAAILALALAATAFGLRARAAGMKPGSLEIAGIKPSSVRSGAYVLSGLGCAVAGVAMAGSIGAWVPNLSSGRGWIALVAVYLGGKSLKGTLLASAAFAILSSLSNRAQALPSMPAELLSALPYVLTALAVLVGSSLKKRP